MAPFRGFGAEAREWFVGLEADNSKQYFSAHRDFFESSVRGQVEALLIELTEEFGGEVKVFRQNRDVRFSRDKSPYKTNTYGILRGSAIAAGGLYASISANGLVAGSGYYEMGREQLERYREGVDDRERGTELAGLVADALEAGLELWGETLATAPRGYAKDHERIELLRRKNFILGATLPFGRGVSREHGLEFVARTWRAAAPVTEWLDAHIGASHLPDSRARAGR